MSAEQSISLNPDVKQAVDELERIVRSRYPEASFKVERGEDNPEGIHLITIVDIEDPDEVLDVVIDRVLHFQIDKGLPVHVIPVRPLEKVIEELKQPKRKVRTRIEFEDVPLGPQP